MNTNIDPNIPTPIDPNINFHRKSCYPDYIEVFKKFPEIYETEWLINLCQGIIELCALPVTPTTQSRIEFLTDSFWEFLEECDAQELVEAIMDE